MKEKILQLEVDILNVKIKPENILDNVKIMIENAAVQATKSIVKQMSDQQEMLEAHTKEVLNTVQEQMTFAHRSSIQSKSHASLSDVKLPTLGNNVPSNDVSKRPKPRRKKSPSIR